MMKNALLIFLIIYTLSACSEKQAPAHSDLVIGNGQMPNLAKDEANNLHVVYGLGDSLMYSVSSDNGTTFSSPFLVSVLPELYAFATRGPQIAATTNSILITASNAAGDIFSFTKENGSKWTSSGKVNDIDTVAKEGLMALSGDGENAFAVWLDLRENKRNKIYGAKSNNGGKTWSKNIMVYTSSDTTVCECCKPSVVVKGNNVYVMFRNWLKGNRDMYVTQSIDGGSSFGQAQKLGDGNWKINGCPMDGGGLVVNKNNEIQTVWRRESKVYWCKPGLPEKEIGEGKGCTLETVNGKTVYAWTENGEVVIIKPEEQKKVIGKGSQPVIKALNNEQMISVWENEKQIHATVVEL